MILRVVVFLGVGVCAMSSLVAANDWQFSIRGGTFEKSGVVSREGDADLIIPYDVIVRSLKNIQLQKDWDSHKLILSFENADDLAGVNIAPADQKRFGKQTLVIRSDSWKMNKSLADLYKYLVAHRQRGAPSDWELVRVGERGVNDPGLSFKAVHAESDMSGLAESDLERFQTMAFPEGGYQLQSEDKKKRFANPENIAVRIPGRWKDLKGGGAQFSYSDANRYVSTFVSKGYFNSLTSDIHKERIAYFQNELDQAKARRKKEMTSLFEKKRGELVQNPQIADIVPKELQPFMKRMVSEGYREGPDEVIRYVRENQEAILKRMALAEQQAWETVTDAEYGETRTIVDDLRIRHEYETIQRQYPKPRAQYARGCTRTSYPRYQGPSEAIGIFDSLLTLAEATTDLVQATTEAAQTIASIPKAVRENTEANRKKKLEEHQVYDNMKALLLYCGYLEQMKL